MNMRVLPRHWSIKNILLFYVALFILATDVLISIFSYQDAAHEIDELFDAQLAQSTRVLAGALSQQLVDWKRRSNQHPGPIIYQAWRYDQSDTSEDRYGHPYESKIYFQLWSADKVLKLHSASSPLLAYAPWEKGFHTIEIEGETWRAFTLYLEQIDHWLISGEKYEIRNELVTKISGRLILIHAILTPLILVLIWIAVTLAFRRLDRISQQIKKRSTKNLSPISVKDAPIELTPLLEAINGLFKKIRKSWERQENFTANAAHELRTPLAAIKVHAQSMEYVDTIQEAKETSKEINGIVNQCTHLVEQLLELARQDQLQMAKSAVNVSELINECCTDLQQDALNKALLFENEIEEDAVIQGHAKSLSIMFKNIISNAIKFTPDKGKIHIRVAVENDKVLISIEDSGMGISESDVGKIFKRFHRSDDAANTSGAGLGLSIVKTIVDNHDGLIQALRSEDLGGAKIMIEFEAYTQR